MEDKDFKRRAFIYSSFVVMMSGLSAWVAYEFGFKKGYFLGLSEYRNMHVDIVKTVIDEVACNAAFESLDMIRSNPSKYELLMKDPQAVLMDVQKAFYKRDDVKALLESLKN